MATPPPPRKDDRLQFFETLTIPTDGVMSLSDNASYAFQHYALFCWLSGTLDNVEVDTIIKSSNVLVKDLKKNGPASIYLILKDGYVKKPLRDAQATERLIVLAIVSQRPHLIPEILRIFPETADPLLLSKLLEPYTNSQIDDYLPYFTDQKPSILSTIKNPGPIKTLLLLGRIRISQNLLLRDAVKARYGMLSVIADPHVFTTSSLVEIEALMNKIETTILTNKSLYSPFSAEIETLKINFQKVKSLLGVGAAITQDAIRRLRLLLGVVDATDAVFDKMVSGTRSF